MSPSIAILNLMTLLTATKLTHKVTKLFARNLEVDQLNAAEVD